jgi:hypothetical protein
MNREDVIKMAREAGLEPDSYSGYLDSEELQAFADLVAAAEREVCAKVCEAWKKWGADGELLSKAIRARGQA